MHRSAESILDKSVEGQATDAATCTLCASNCAVDSVPDNNLSISHLTEQDISSEALPSLDTLTSDKVQLVETCGTSAALSDLPQHVICVEAATSSMIAHETRQRFMEAYDNAELELAEDLACACASCM